MQQLVAIHMMVADGEVVGKSYFWWLYNGGAFWNAFGLLEHTDQLGERSGNYWGAQWYSHMIDDKSTTLACNASLAICLVISGDIVYIVDANTNVPTLLGDRVYNFEPHKWYLAWRKLDLLKDHRFSRHVLKTGHSILFPNDAPHCVHSLPNTIGPSSCIKETLSPDRWVSEAQVSHRYVVRHDPIPHLPVSPDHFGVSLHENLKVGPRKEEPILVVHQ